MQKPHAKKDVSPHSQSGKSGVGDEMEKALDEALKETFPASDPIAVDADLLRHVPNIPETKK